MGSVVRRQGLPDMAAQQGKAMKHDLTPTQYLYRGHYIMREVDPDRGVFWWVSSDVPNGAPMYTNKSIDNCTTTIDEMLDDA
jgi:hypothetical protein